MSFVMNRAFSPLLLAIGLILLVVVGWSFSDFFQDDDEKKLKIGVMLPLSGDFSYWGESQRRGIALAMENGLAGNLEFIFQDTQCTTNQGVNAAQLLRNTEDIKVFLVACDNEVKAIAPSLDPQTNLIFISGLSGQELYDSPTPIINLSYTLENEGSTAASFIFKKLNKKTLGILVGNNSFGTILGDVIEREFATLGGNITAKERIAINEADPTAIAVKVFATNPEAIFIHNDINPTAIILKRLREYGYQGEIVTYYTNHDPAMIKVAGEAVEDVYFTWPSNEDARTQMYRDLTLQYREKYTSEPSPTTFFVYDGVRLLNAAQATCSGNTQCIEDFFYQQTDFDGVLGRVTYKAEGATHRRLYLDVVKNGQFVPVDF